MTDPHYIPAPPSDFVLPFELPEAGLRGRLVRLDAVSTRALVPYTLPQAGCRVLAEALGLSAILGSALKLEGRLSIQTKGDGPLDLLATDYFGAEDKNGAAGLRGFVRLKDRSEATPVPDDFANLVGAGSLAVTIEPKKGDQTYQGLVSLSPNGLAASAETYFAQSEQLPTLLRLSAGPIYRAGSGNGWRAGGLMVQALPRAEIGTVEGSDDWRRIRLFLDTLDDAELLDSDIAAESVLWRLFHEDEIRVHRAETLEFKCSCRPERIGAVLKVYSPPEIAALADPDGVVRTRCEFCGTVYEFPPETLPQTLNP